MKVIAFGGPAQAGKSTIAGILAGIALDAGYRIKRLEFAGPLKKAAARVGASKSKDPTRYRDLCQKWGAGKRAGDPEYWVKRVRKQLRKLAETEHSHYLKHSRWDETVVILDDCRYLNEIDLVREFNGRMIFVDPGYRLSDEDLSEDFRKHESEQLAFEYMNGEHKDTLFDDVIVNGEDDLKTLAAVVTLVAPSWFDDLDLMLWEDDSCMD
tara:strand:- start:5580 stop:6212 length:633 start_codon:yes stop_codon:yes gene_type:complete